MFIFETPPPPFWEQYITSAEKKRSSVRGNFKKVLWQKPPLGAIYSTGFFPPRQQRLSQQLTSHDKGLEAEYITESVLFQQYAFH